MKTTLPTAEQLKLDWTNNPRWAGVERTYSAEDVVRLRGTIPVDHSIARLGAEKLWKSLQTEDFINALGAMTGNQAMQQVKAGLKAIYLSGWQVAADANIAADCCSTDLIGTKRIVGRITASQIASASATSFFCRLT